MKKSKLFVFVILIAAIVITAGIFWNLFRKSENGSSAPATAKVIRRDFSSTVLATGAVNPKVGSEVKVGARISGKVLRLYANIGDVVKKGQVLAELEKEDIEARVNQRTAELEVAESKLAAVKSLRPKEIEKAESEVAQRQATVDLNRAEIKRQAEMLKQDLIPQQVYDQIKEQLAVSETQLVSAQNPWN